MSLPTESPGAVEIDGIDFDTHCRCGGWPGDMHHGLYGQSAYGLLKSLVVALAFGVAAALLITAVRSFG
jgi:hypothetical protein